MVGEIALYHSGMVNIFLFMLFVNLLIPYLFRRKRYREIKATRITFFFFSALISMVAFTGIVLYIMMDTSWSIEITVMSAAFVVLSALEIVRSRKLVKAWRADSSGASSSWPYVAAEILITLSVVLFELIGKKDAVPL